MHSRMTSEGGLTQSPLMTALHVAVVTQGVGHGAINWITLCEARIETECDTTNVGGDQRVTKRSHQLSTISPSTYPWQSNTALQGMSCAFLSLKLCS